MLSLKTWHLARVKVSLSKNCCYKMALIGFLPKWIMRHLRRLVKRRGRVLGLILMLQRMSLLRSI